MPPALQAAWLLYQTGLPAYQERIVYSSNTAWRLEDGTLRESRHSLHSGLPWLDGGTGVQGGGGGASSNDVLRCRTPLLAPCSGPAACCSTPCHSHDTGILSTHQTRAAITLVLWVPPLPSEDTGTAGTAGTHTLPLMPFWYCLNRLGSRRSSTPAATPRSSAA